MTEAILPQEELSGDGKELSEGKVDPLQDVLPVEAASGVKTNPRLDSTKVYPNLSGQKHFKIIDAPYAGSLMRYDPSGENQSDSWAVNELEVTRIDPKFDYEKGVVTFDLYYMDSRRKSGQYDVDSFDDFGGRNSSESQVEYEDVEKLAGSVKNKIDPMNMPVEFDDTETFVRYQKVTSRNEIKPILYRKDDENRLIAVADWDENRQKWVDTEKVFPENTLFRIKDGEEIISILSPEQLQMTEFQKVIIKPENSVFPSETVPAPHLPGDDVPISVRRQNIVDRLNELKRISAQEDVDIRQKESIAKAAEEARILEAKLDGVESIIGKDSIEKIAKIVNLHATYRGMKDVPTELDSVVRHWKKLIDNIDINIELDPIQKTDIDYVSEQFEEIDSEILEGYLSKIAVKNWGIYAKIVVENGQIYNASDYARGEMRAIDKFVVGESNRSLNMKNKVNNSVVLVPGGQWGPEDGYGLEDGQYAIRRNVSEVYVVEFDSLGKISRVLEKCDSLDAHL